MARHLGWAALAVAAAALVGCGPEKELPSDLPPATDTGERVVATPTASEPTATAYVEKAVKAYTGGKPDLVAKGKLSRLTVKGTLLYPIDNQKTPVDTVRTSAAVWPDRFAGTNELQIQGTKATVRAWLHRPNFTLMNGQQEIQPANRPEAEQNFAADVTAQHWMALFLPVTDPKAIVFDLQKRTTAQQPVQTLRLALPGFPTYLLTFDANTDALLRVDYTLSELGAQRRRQWTMIDHKPGPNGLVLPGKMECRHDNIAVEEWAAEKWEFPAAIDDKEFTPPKP